MNLIIDFYKELDTLNLIIFWGIIIVIILLLIFSFILINKNKKLKKMVEKQNKYEEEIPIKQQELTKEEAHKINKETDNENINKLEESIESNVTQENISKSIEIEKNFIAEEHVSEYQNDEIHTTKEKKVFEDTRNNKKITANNIEIPTKPYQRNVLREMSLSQTSPIGINRPNVKEDKKEEMIKDLEESLSDKNIETQTQPEQKIKQERNENINNTINRELSRIKDNSYRKTEIKHDISSKQQHDNLIQEQIKTPIPVDTNKGNNHANILENYQDLANSPDEKKEKNSSEKYLEEVSRKLAEAEVPDEIERTSYEIKQEEDAIISYKELMEKKDSIQTIDEEEAVISIEELMNRANPKSEESKSESKLYRLSEEEANENFIKELKQFRNDL